MNGLAGVSLAWASVYAGLAAFFLVVAPRFAGRGYALLGGAMGGVALASFGTWLAFSSGPGMGAFTGGRLLLWGATFAPAFNTHFVLRFTRHLRFERWSQLGYVLAGSAAVADLTLTLGALSSAADGHTLRELLSPSPILATSISVLFGVHLFLAACMLLSAVRRGMPSARWPFLLLALLGPIVIYDYTRILHTGQNYYITEGLTWIYGLVIVASLLTELRGAEGLLEQTTTILTERTAELQSSYLELDLVHTELSRKEQLAAVGELAASIAHEVRNPLAIIMNAASGLRRKTISEADKTTLLSIVDEESARLNQLVTELLRFARPVTAAKAPASLLDICRQVQSAAPENYRVNVHAPRDQQVDQALVDPGLFRLALDNLIANAIQAMPDGGDIDLFVQRGQLTDGSDAACVELRDRGHGMTPEDLERARKPFFTTRPRGTGLGLPIVDRILEAHGGEVALTSEPGQGTRVTLKVPLESEAPTSGRLGSKPTQRRRLRSIPGIGSEPAAVREGERISSPIEAPPPPPLRDS